MDGMPTKAYRVRMTGEVVVYATSADEAKDQAVARLADGEHTDPDETDYNMLWWIENMRATAARREREHDLADKHSLSQKEG